MRYREDRMKNQSIPIIDLTSYFEGTKEGKLKVANEVNKEKLMFLII